jgi:hypothetical protein
MTTDGFPRGGKSPTDDNSCFPRARGLRLFPAPGAISRRVPPIIAGVVGSDEHPPKP